MNPLTMFIFVTKWFVDFSVVRVFLDPASSGVYRDCTSRHFCKGSKIQLWRLLLDSDAVCMVSLYSNMNIVGNKYYVSLNIL